MLQELNGEKEREREKIKTKACYFLPIADIPWPLRRSSSVTSIIRIYSVLLVCMYKNAYTAYSYWLEDPHTHTCIRTPTQPNPIACTSLSGLNRFVPSIRKLLYAHHDDVIRLDSVTLMLQCFVIHVDLLVLRILCLNPISFHTFNIESKFEIIDL